MDCWMKREFENEKYVFLTPNVDVLMLSIKKLISKWATEYIRKSQIQV